LHGACWCPFLRPYIEKIQGKNDLNFNDNGIEATIHVLTLLRRETPHDIHNRPDKARKVKEIRLLGRKVIFAQRKEINLCYRIGKAL